MPSRSRPGSRVTWAAPLALLFLAPLGCASTLVTPKAKADPVAECKALVQLVNSGVQRVDSKLAATNDPAEELRATAVAVDELAVQIGKLPLREPKLKRLATDYQSMARALASGTRELAGGVREGDRAVVARAQETIKAAVAQEDPIVDKINGFCTGSQGTEPAGPPGPQTDPEGPPGPRVDPDDGERHET